MNLPKLKKITGCHADRKKKRILFLSDDFRLHSGISTITREIVLGTVHKYDFSCLGGAIKNPNAGQRLDLSQDISQQTGVEDASVKLYPINGYGNPDIVRQLIQAEKPDMIIIYTDPRFWGFIFQMEAEIRQVCPLVYISVWDSMNYPYYNSSAYESCDLLLGISKQSHNIHKQVLKKSEKFVEVIDLDEQEKSKINNKSKTYIAYFPHGINEKQFYPIREGHQEYHDLQKYKDEKLGELDFLLFFNSRNIKRKMPGDIILAYKTFCDTLPKEKSEKCVLLMHTHPSDPNGTDLPALISAVCPDYRILFSDYRASTQQLNYMYNLASVTINISSNEGFGLSIAESLMAGTPVIVNVTGGLIDQCRFVDENNKMIKYTEKWSSNHDARYTKCGEWAIPIFPSNRALVGSVPTPYIFDDRCRWEDVAIAIKQYYSMTEEEWNRRGNLGRKWVMSNESMMSAKNMCAGFIRNIDTLFKVWEPPKRFNLINTDIPRKKLPGGITSSKLEMKING